MKSVLAILLGTITFISLDLLWLGVIAKDFYQSHLGDLLARPNWIAAGFFYVLYIAGIVFFVISPQLTASKLRVFLTGGLLGLLCYGTYDLTNLATLKGFPLQVAVVDMIWGFVITSIVSLVIFSFYK